jgi:hypothetical protein
MAAPETPPYPAPAAAKTTPAQLCRWALMSLGRLGATQPLDGDDLIVTFEMLNGMIDAWRLNELLLNNITRAGCQLKPGVNRYAIGPGGDFGRGPAYGGSVPGVDNTGAFPPQILFGSLILDSFSTSGVFAMSSQSIERPLGMPRDVRNVPAGLYLSQVVSDFPDRLFYNPTYHGAWGGVPPGCGAVWVYPTPNNDRHALFVWYPEMLDTFRDPLAEYYLAPGIVRALRTNLAMEIAPLFNAEPSAELRKQAKAAYDAIQIVGGRPNEQRFDPILIGQHGRYNLFADDWSKSQ